MELNFKLKIKEQEIELTYEEGRELFNILKRVYGEQHTAWNEPITYTFGSPKLETPLRIFGDDFKPSTPFVSGDGPF